MSLRSGATAAATATAYLEEEVARFEARAVRRATLVDAVQVLEGGEVWRGRELERRRRRHLSCNSRANDILARQDRDTRRALTTKTYM